MASNMMPTTNFMKPVNRFKITEQEYWHTHTRYNNILLLRKERMLQMEYKLMQCLS